MHNILWMLASVFLLYSLEMTYDRKGECCNETLSYIMMNERGAHCMVLTVLVKSNINFFVTLFLFVILFGAWFILQYGFPNYPGGLYGTFFSCGVVVFFSYHLFAHIRSVSKAAYSKVRSAGNRVRTYILGIRRDA